MRVVVGPRDIEGRRIARGKSIECDVRVVDQIDPGTRPRNAVYPSGMLDLELQRDWS